MFMKDKLQYEKAQTKMNIIEKLIEGLSDYNNISNYNNVKNLNIKVGYIYDVTGDFYKYYIKLYRGINNPTQILDLHLNYKEKINDLILEMIDKLVKNKYFYYTAFSKDRNSVNYYSVNLKGDVSINFQINDDNDKDFYNSIEQKYEGKTILGYNNYREITSEMKDDVQQEKAIKIINLLSKILNSLCKYNNLENYDNIKPYKLEVSNKYDKTKQCYKFIFTIVRGNKHPEEMLELTCSVKDKNFIYSIIYDMMLDFVSKEEFIYNSINTSFNKCFDINLKYGIQLSFKINDFNDNIFYENFFNECKKKIYELEQQKTLSKTYNEQ